MRTTVAPHGTHPKPHNIQGSQLQTHVKVFNMISNPILKLGRGVISEVQKVSPHPSRRNETCILQGLVSAVPLLPFQQVTLSLIFETKSKTPFLRAFSNSILTWTLHVTPTPKLYSSLNQFPAPPSPD